MKEKYDESNNVIGYSITDDIQIYKHKEKFLLTVKSIDLSSHVICDVNHNPKEIAQYAILEIQKRQKEIQKMLNLVTPFI